MKETLEAILESSFLDYSAFVLQRRAIPDARDGMKYTARQILHAQFKDKLDAKHPFKKSQKSVSAATAFSYVHGDTSAYEQIIRMGRPLVQRYFMEEINGNGGTPTGSWTYSAPRYTEARLSPLGMKVFEYINSGTLEPQEWAPTYDEEGVFPLVLPSVGFYNMVNGSFGSIGVGLISSIPQFNLREMNRELCKLIDNPEAEIELLPDFASGGILLNPKTTATSLARGEGKSALVRSKVKKNKKEGWLEVLELPYGVYTNTICVELDKALDKGKAPFTKFKDLSQRTVQLRIYAPDLDALEEWLYKNTSVQKHFTIKLIMLDKGKTPKKFTLRQALLAHVDHAKKVYRRQYEHELRLLTHQQEILEGLIRAHSIIDEIIDLIKASSGRMAAIIDLQEVYKFTPDQAAAIVDLRLHRLSSMDVYDLQKDLDKCIADQNGIQQVLANENLFNQELKQIYEKIASDFGDNRRTEISESDVWETEQEGGKATRDFYARFTPDGYDAAYMEDDEIFDGDSYADNYMEHEIEYIIVTTQMRGFLKKGSDFVMGHVAWKDMLALKDGEKVLFVVGKQDLEANHEFVDIITDSGTWSLHISFICMGATARGKKLVTGKYNAIGYSLLDGKSENPKMR